MADEHLDQQHRLSYVARGPEWAFVVPQGDLDAFDDVVRRVSSVWNGANALFFAVDRAGRFTIADEMLAGLRPVDAVWLHPRLGERALAAARRRFPTATPLHERFDHSELHALLLVPEPPEGAPKPSLLIPAGETEDDRRLVSTLWGHVASEDLPFWRGRFDIAEVGGEAFLPALLDGQTARFSSPLVVTRQFMGVAAQRGPLDWPYLCVLPDRLGFSALVRFWNFRSRAMVDVPGMPVVALPRAALRRPELLRGLRQWIAPAPGTQRKPDLLVWAPAEVADDLDAAMRTAAFELDRGSRLSHSIGDRVEPRERPSYRYCAPQVGGRFLRGASALTLATFIRGRSSLTLPQPEGIAIRSGHIVRVVLRDLPLPLPLTDDMAKLVHPHAVARDGALLHLGTYGDWNVDIALPDSSQALRAWASGHGCAVRITQDGRYATALLARLVDLDRLDALAAELPVTILEELTPVSRLKWAQRLAAEFRGSQDVDEQRLAEHLRDAGLFLERPSKTAADLASQLRTRASSILKVLSPLVDAGYVVRGRALRCPQCNYPLWFSLDELAEHVSCAACRARLLVPLADPDGRREAATQYRLDGLMARAMDQDLLPVLLAVRAFRRLFDGYAVHTWPGTVLTHAGGAVDVDLLVHGPWTACCEVKANATALGTDQLDKLIEVCDRVGARPCIAALRGTFSEELAVEVRRRDGVVLDRAQLLAQ